MKVSDFFKKTFAGPKLRVSQAGQAVVEYLLMLIMTVSIIMGILYQFNDAFRNFLDSYFGDYIACLLETGELPSLGGQGPNKSECNRGFASFSLANGRPSKASSGGSSSKGSGSNSSSPPASSGTSSSNSKGSRPARFNSSNAPANADAFGSDSNRNRPAKQNVNNNQQLGDEKGLGSGTSDGGASGGGRRIVNKKIIYLGDNYLTADALKKKERKVSIGKKSKGEREMMNLRKARFELQVPESKRPLATEEKQGFSFALLIKILLIGGILIVLFIFLGGQALQIKKSWQKSE
jgi:hypothetical protein